ncbi:MAG TPA: hypothetical protein VFR65_05120 [Nitrososphaeraceae archaeon]|nr:hypothetical protein [Nitrososphaeraceae archaeon]
MGKKFTILLYAAAATTLIAGILHLTKVQKLSVVVMVLVTLIFCF